MACAQLRTSCPSLFKQYLLTTLKEKSLQSLRNAISNEQNNIEQMIHKFNGACLADRLTVHTNNNNTLKSIYNSPFHSIIICGITLGVTHQIVAIFTLKENHQNYGLCTTKNFMSKSI
jgi:hypothetical protein